MLHDTHIWHAFPYSYKMIPEYTHLLLYHKYDINKIILPLGGHHLVVQFSGEFSNNLCCQFSFWGVQSNVSSIENVLE